MIRPTTHIRLSLLLAASLLVGGCNYGVNTYEQANPDAQPNVVALNKVTTSGKLQRRATVLSAYETRDNDLLRVAVNIANRDRKTFRGNETRGFKYKFTWIGPDGIPLYDPTGSDGWKTQLLQTKEFTTITSTAPTPRAVDWRLALELWDGD